MGRRKSTMGHGCWGGGDPCKIASSEFDSQVVHQSVVAGTGPIRAQGQQRSLRGEPARSNQPLGRRWTIICGHSSKVEQRVANPPMRGSTSPWPLQFLCVSARSSTAEQGPYKPPIRVRLPTCQPSSMRAGGTATSRGSYPRLSGFNSQAPLPIGATLRNHSATSRGCHLTR